MKPTLRNTSTLLSNYKIALSRIGWKFQLYSFPIDTKSVHELRQGADHAGVILNSSIPPST